MPPRLSIVFITRLLVCMSSLAFILSTSKTHLPFSSLKIPQPAPPTMPARKPTLVTSVRNSVGDIERSLMPSLRKYSLSPTARIICSTLLIAPTCFARALTSPLRVLTGFAVVSYSSDKTISTSGSRPLSLLDDENLYLTLWIYNTSYDESIKRASERRNDEPATRLFKSKSVSPSCNNPIRILSKVTTHVGFISLTFSSSSCLYAVRRFSASV